MKLKTTTLVILSIMYTTTIFGTNETTLSQVINTVPEDIYNLIDEFRGENDGFFKETGYIKPYSCSLDLISKYLPVICATVVFFLTIFKLLSKIDFFLTSFFSWILAVVTKSAVHKIVAAFPLFVKNHQDEKFPEILFIEKDQDGEFSENDEEYICIKKNFIRAGVVIRSVTHYRPLSDMRPKSRAPSNHILQTYIPLGDQDPGKLVYFKLENWKINAYLPDDYRESKNKLHSLPTSEKVNSFALFKKREVMVTSSERGIIRWESERNKELHKIMNSTKVAQYNQNSD